MCAYQPSRLCECCAASWRPAPVVMRMTSGTLNWPPDMCEQGGRVVQDLVEREQAEVDGHDLDDRAHPAERGADAGADEGRLRQRRVADPLGAELLEQAQAHGEAAAVAADVLAHQEHPLVAVQRLADAPRASPRGRSSSWRRPRCRRTGSRSSTGSSVPGLGEGDRGVDLGGDLGLDGRRCSSSSSRPASVSAVVQQRRSGRAPSTSRPRPWPGSARGRTSSGPGSGRCAARGTRGRPRPGSRSTARRAAASTASTSMPSTAQAGIS